MDTSSQKKLTGTTWDVYLCVLTSGESIGVRDVWRNLKLSSPSLAQYHVNKLLDLKLIETTVEGKYKANNEEQLGALRSFVKLRGRLVPRLVLYGAVVTGILMSYLLLWPLKWDFRDLTVVFVSVFSISAIFFEAYNQMKALRIA
ncbi:hypothetical protein MUP77_12825 [Candidatus Bathyarchaeota archaeon]|nr:hypothetical protein [Candidatus Bathyarchaeota archaeon]